ncbi:MAG: PH domain-containing protein [Halanaeroarchaeum sp.]
MQRLDSRVRLVWAIAGLVSAVVLGGIAVALLAILLDWPIWPGIVLGVLVAVIGVGYAVLRYRIWRFDVQEDALFLDRGVLTRIRTVVPYVRVQHVDTRRNPIERVAGLERVVVYTAGSRGADVAIPGLTPERASDLQHRLRSLVGESEAEDAV